jgi:acyl dehydratase
MNDMPFLTNKTYDEVQVGDSAYIERQLTKEDITNFAMVSSDCNPAHVDPEYAKETFFKQVIGHGMWSGSLISAVIGTKLPGPGSIYISQSFSFKGPVYVGDVIRAEVTIKQKNEKNRIILDCKCTNQKGEVVLTGEAEASAPKKKFAKEVVIS